MESGQSHVIHCRTIDVWIDGAIMRWRWRYDDACPSLKRAQFSCVMRHRTITIALSRNRHCIIASSVHRPNPRWCDSVHYVALSRFHISLSKSLIWNWFRKKTRIVHYITALQRFCSWSASSWFWNNRDVEAEYGVLVFSYNIVTFKLVW